MSDARFICTAGIPAARVGSLLANARIAAGLTRTEVAHRLRLSPRDVKEWERGEVVPSDEQLEAFADACGVRVRDVVPRRVDLAYDAATGTMHLGDKSSRLPTSMRAEDDDVIAAFLALVREQRGLRPTADVAVRVDDLEVLAQVLDLSDEELEERLVGVLGVTRRQAAALRAQMVRRRMTVGAVAMLAGIGLLSANRAFGAGTQEVRAVGGGRTTRGTAAVTTTVPPAQALPSVASTTTTTVATTTTGAPAPTAAIPTAATPPPTLPAVVLAETVFAPPTTTRTGPPRTTPTRTGGGAQPTPPLTEAPPGTDPVLPGPPTLPPTPPPTPKPPPTPPPTPPVLPGPPTLPSTPPTVEDPDPVVPPVGGGGTTGTTDPTTPTTDPTDPDPTIPTTDPDPTIPTTDPDPTTTSSTTTSTTTTVPVPDGPLAPVAQP